MANVTPLNTEQPRQEYEKNVVLSVDFANELVKYLNTKPRSEVDAMARVLEEHTPTVGVFMKQVDEYYHNLEKKNGQ